LSKTCQRELDQLTFYKVKADISEVQIYVESHEVSPRMALYIPRLTEEEVEVSQTTKTSTNMKVKKNRLY